MKWLSSFLVFWTVTAWSDSVSYEQPLYVADITLQNEQEFVQLLERAEQLILAGSPVEAGQPRVTFVLHGPVLRSLLRDDYLENKRLVDLAASLSALEVIDVKACNTWMGLHGLEAGDLQPFVDVVVYGPGEVERLAKTQNYVDF
ncbi:MAG: hypothetical protein AAGA91_17310 [Pseudomonadota bacterium]